jgi:hypothetical protein
MKETKPMLKGVLSKYVATPMHMTLTLRLESGEEVMLPLDGDLFTRMFGDHERVSYIPADAGAEYVPPDKVTCEIEHGTVTKTIVETDGIETEEERK